MAHSTLAPAQPLTHAVDRPSATVRSARSSRRLRPSGLSIARALHRRALAAAERGNFHVASELHRLSLHALGSRRTAALVHRAESLRVRILGDWGNTCRAFGRYACANRQLREALALSRRVHGPAALETRQLLNALGVLGKVRGRYALAERLYRQALAAAQAEARGGDTDELATLYHNLGGIEHARGHFARGEPLARRAVEIRRRVRGRHDPAVWADEAALAAILVGRKRYAAAERIYRRVLRQFRTMGGDRHYEVAATLQNLAALQQLTGRWRAARRNYERALAIKSHLLGGDHVELGLILHHLALLRRPQSASEAVALWNRALPLLARALPSSHPWVVACRRRRAEAARSPGSSSRLRHRKLG